jgi:uncharacterized protein YcbX
MELAEVVGQLVGLRRFPIEPLGGETPNEVNVRPTGAVGDRVYELAERESGAALSWRTAPELLLYAARYLEDLVVEDLENWARVRLPGGKEFALADPEWLADVSRRLGRSVVLRQSPPDAATRGVLHLVSRATLRFVERVYGTSIEPRFQRANFVVDLSGGKAFEEDEWIGRQIRIGDTLCDVVGASMECFAISSRPEKPAGDLSMVEGLLKVRGGVVGLQVRTAKGHRIRVADPVSVVD